MNNQLKQNFISLVTIDSISQEEEKLKKFIQKKFSKRGIYFKEDNYGNLYYSNKHSELLLTAHLDTVEPGRNIKVVQKNDLLCSEGSTILGADNKAGLAVIFTLLENLSVEALSKIEVLFTIREEQGLLGARNFDIHLLNSPFGISLDKSNFNFGECMITGSDAAEVFELIFKGKSFHSARQMPDYNPLNLFIKTFSNLLIGPLGKETSFNIGKISGFQQLNSSPEELHIFGDIRSSSKKKIDAFYQNVNKNIKESKMNVEYEIKREVVTDNFLLDKDKPGYEAILELLVKLHYKPAILKRGSITDASVLSSKGLNTFLLSCGVYNTHQTDEYVLWPEMEKAYEFLDLLIKKF
jgi:tripeptide aminopeptidase